MTGLELLRTIANRSRVLPGPGILQSVFRRAFRHVHGRRTVSDFDGCLTMTLDLSEHMQRRIFWMGYYNLRLMPLLDQMLRPGMVVIDVGANIGEVSLVAGRRVGPQGRVIAFEPAPTIADELETHVQRNQMQDVVHIERLGLADKPATLPLYASCGQADTADPHRGLGSLHGEPDKDALLAVVEVATLDHMAEQLALDRLDLLKVDIEGGELPCLRGAEKTLRRFLPIIAVEVQSQSAGAAGYQGRDVLDFLAPLGYRFYRLETRGRLRPIDAGMLTDYQDVICIAGPKLPFET